MDRFGVLRARAAHQTHALLLFLLRGALSLDTQGHGCENAKCNAWSFTWINAESLSTLREFPDVAGKNIFLWAVLNWGITSEQIEQAFAEYGVVTSAKVISDRETGRSKGFAFVEMETGGEEAIKALNGADLDGRVIVGDEARPREDQSRYGSGGYGRGGYGGGRNRTQYGVNPGQKTALIVIGVMMMTLLMFVPQGAENQRIALPLSTPQLIRLILHLAHRFGRIRSANLP